MSPPTTPASYADLGALPEQMTGEILHGVLYATPRPRPSHGLVALRIGMRIGGFDHDAPDGWHIRPEPEIRLSAEDIVVPDLAGWRRAEVPVLPDDVPLTIVPAWVCEIASPGTRRRDRQVKLPIYAAAGVAWAWFVEPGPAADEQALEIYERTGDRWTLVGTYTPDDGQIDVPPFGPIDLAEIWRA